MPVYNKLVRDLIPKIIQEDGKTCTTRTLSNDEWVNAIQEKLFEEAEEVKSARSKDEQLEELADILELLHAHAHAVGATFEDIENIRKKKKAQRGGFDEAIFLIEVKEDET